MGQRRRQQGKTGGKTGNNSIVLAPMPALKPLIWSVVAHSHRRLVDEGRADAAKAVAPNGLDYATLQADLAAWTAAA
jgi:hypothetical protein